MSEKDAPARPRVFSLAAALLLAAVGALHVARLAAGTEVLVGGRAVPLAASVPAALACFALAALVWREGRR